MFEILEKKKVADRIFQIKLNAPNVAKAAVAGQFCIIRTTDKGERIPLSLGDFDPETGHLTLIYMTIGKTTMELAAMNEGEKLADIVGPLGEPTHIEKFGHVVCVAGGFGAAPLYRIAKAYKDAGNKVTIIQGARNKDLLIYEDLLDTVSDNVIICTDDGSKGVQGVVTVPLEELIKNEGVDLVFAIGPAIMMKFTCLLTEKYDVKTIVSLNPIMVDGTGMCGACRVEIGGQTKFGCIHGPDFDGHEVNWDLFMSRQRMYLGEEKLALEKWECDCEPQNC